MIKYFVALIVILLANFEALCQIEKASGQNYQVSYAQFSPPTKDVIKALEGSKATPFLAKDQFQQDLYLGDLLGKDVLLWFWDPLSSICVEHLHEINQAANYFENDMVEIVGFAKGNRGELDKFIASHQIDFRVIPNAGIFAEGPYVGELGFPRMFFINKSGIIHKIIPSEAMASTSNTLELVKEILNEQVGYK